MEWTLINPEKCRDHYVRWTGNVHSHRTSHGEHFHGQHKSTLWKMIRFRATWDTSATACTPPLPRSDFCCCSSTVSRQINDKQMTGCLQYQITGAVWDLLCCAYMVNNNDPLEITILITNPTQKLGWSKLLGWVVVFQESQLFYTI